MNDIQCVFVFDLPVPAGHRCIRHQHPCTEIVINRDGSGRHYINTRPNEYHDRSVLLYQPGTEHWLENDTPGSQLCIGVAGLVTAALATAPATMVATPEIIAIAASITEEINRRDAFSDGALDYWCGLLVLALRRATENAAEPRSNFHPLAEKARKILDVHFKDALRMKEVAESLYLCPDYLRQLFKANFGESPMNYVIGRRIDAARKLLSATDEPVKNIAAACGFSNPYYFARLFKKVTGQTPSEYRRRK